jgi:hypothetical protein
MAATAEVISQTSSINLISKSISSTRSTLTSSNVTIGRIQKIIETKTKVRSDLFFKNQIIERRRKEATKRKEYEDQIEASKVTTNFQSGLRVASSSSQGPLSRILSFLGYLGAGWILENLPTWIAMGKEFIARMKKAGEIIYSIPQTMYRILQSFGTTLGFISRDIRNLDFTDSSGDIRNSFSELTSTVELLGTQIADGFKALLEPTGEVDIPSTGEQQPDTESSGVPAPTPGGGSGGGRWKPLLDLIHSVESSTDKKNNGYDAQNGAPGGVRPGLSQMTIGEIARTAPGASGRYQQMPQFLLGRAKAAGYNENTVFSPQVQDVLAVKLIEGKGGNSWLSGKMKTEDFMQGLADVWAALPNAYGNFSYSGQSSSLKPEKVKSVLAQVKQQSSSAPPRPTSTGTMNLIPQTGSGGFIQGGSGSGGDTTYATHFHIDAKTTNPSAAQLANIREVSFQAVKAMFARGSWVHFGNIKKDVYSNVSDSELKALIAAEQRAHGARSSAGVDIQEHNPKTKQTFPSQPGSATKFPFAVGEVYYRGGYGREAEIIGSGGITVSHGAAGSKASQVSPQLAKIPSEKEVTPAAQQPQISSAVSQQQRAVADSVTTERMGQQFLFIDDRSSAQQPSVSVGSQKSYGGGVSGQIAEFDLLNKFMKQKLLLDFNYL